MVVDELQRATPVGGVHLLRGRPNRPATVTFDEWRAWYSGWAVTTESTSDPLAPCTTYVARRVAGLGG
jgi:hypothetical protein